MLRITGLFLAFCLTCGSVALAQSVSTLEITSEPDAAPLEVTVEVGSVVDALAQLSADPAGAILLDFREETALGVSSEAATAVSDLVLIAPNGTIMAIVRRAAPGSQNPIGFSGPVAAILQINAGGAEEAGLKPGGSVAHNILGNQGSGEE